MNFKKTILISCLTLNGCTVPTVLPDANQAKDNSRAEQIVQLQKQLDDLKKTSGAATSPLPPSLQSNAPMVPVLNNNNNNQNNITVNVPTTPAAGQPVSPPSPALVPIPTVTPVMPNPTFVPSAPPNQVVTPTVTASSTPTPLVTPSSTQTPTPTPSPTVATTPTPAPTPTPTPSGYYFNNLTTQFVDTEWDVFAQDSSTNPSYRKVAGGVQLNGAIGLKPKAIAQNTYSNFQMSVDFTVDSIGGIAPSPWGDGWMGLSIYGTNFFIANDTGGTGGCAHLSGKYANIQQPGCTGANGSPISYQFNVGQTYSLKAKIIGSQLSLDINNSNVITTSKADWNNDGNIGFQTYLAKATFSNFEIKVLP